MPKGVAKVPQVMQMESRECGAACLGMILAYYGRWVPLERLRFDCGVSRDGANAFNIIMAAQNYGLASKGRAMGLDALKDQQPFPCIVFWNFNHYVVLDGFAGKYAYLNDPARGEVRVTMDEFESSFTGVVIVFEKTDAFEEGGAKPDSKGFIRERMKGLGWPVAFIMGVTALASIINIISSSLSRVFIDQVLTLGNDSVLVPLVAIVIAIALVSCLLGALKAVELMRVQGKIAVVSSSKFMRHLLHLPAGFYEQRTVGDLQQRQQSNEGIAYQLVGQLAPVLVNAVMLVLYLVIMLNYSVMLTMVGVATVIMNALVARYISKKRVNISRSMTANKSKLFSTSVSGVKLIETIKSSGAETGFFGRWAGYQAAVNNDQARQTTLNEYLGAIPTALSELANVAVLVLGVVLIVDGQFTVGSLLAFQGFLSSFMSPVKDLINLGQTVQEMRTQIERVEDVMGYEADVPEEEDFDELVESIQNNPEKLRGQVDLDHVSFGYSPLEPPLIEDLSLHMEPGAWVALVGASGCGKSTVAKLVSGLYEPWSGEIRFDGRPAGEVPRHVLRGSLSVVDQDIVTFSDSIADNVRLWDRSIEDGELIRACRDACIHDDIASREDGYLGRVLPGGRNFSGGQLQRLEIARALAAEPSVLILDEATSALDAQTEAEVIRNIRARHISCILVAHRLSTIRDCDEIIMLDGGKVVERGTHGELLAADGAYARLVRSE